MRVGVVLLVRVEDLTPIEKGGVAIRSPVDEFVATVPGFLVFLVIFVLALLILRRTPVTILWEER